MKYLILAAIVTVCVPLCGIYARESSAYMGEEARDIKALSGSEIAGLLEGKGMGYAKAAELNGFPGPAHVLELAEKLGLSPALITATQAIFDRMESAAKELGAELVDAERELDARFRNKTIDEKALTEITGKIGRLQSRLRAVHLNAHLEQHRLLNDAQIAKYMALRGYAKNGHGDHHHHHQQQR